jgi:hypothetical protein
MKRLFFALILLLSPCLSQAASPDRFGLGIVIGYPLGITGKYWLGTRNAVDGALAVFGENDLYLHMDYLWHDYRAFPKPEEGKLPLYYGVGGSLASHHGLGVRGVIGINYLFQGYPFDLFMELGPVLYFAPDVDLTFTGGIGGRYYFQ